MGFALSDMMLTSSAFETGTTIPKRHTGEGEDLSPPLAWSRVPAEADSLIVACHDPDAPLVSPEGAYGYVHWVHYNIPASVSELPEGGGGYTGGTNDFGNTGYGGPMPPNGHGVHHYYFWLLALRGQEQFIAGLTLWELLRQAEPRVIGMNRLVGTYERK